MIEDILNPLEKLTRYYNKYNQHTNKLLEQINDFENRYELPIGVSVKTPTNLLCTGIITVEIIPKCKDYFNIKIHPRLTRELDLKLIKIHNETIYYEDMERTIYTYEYTYTDNPLFKELKIKKEDV